MNNDINYLFYFKLVLIILIINTSLNNINIKKAINNLYKLIVLYFIFQLLKYLFLLFILELKERFDCMHCFISRNEFLFYLYIFI